MIIDTTAIAFYNSSVAEIYFRMKQYDKVIEIISNNIDNSTH